MTFSTESHPNCVIEIAAPRESINALAEHEAIRALLPVPQDQDRSCFLSAVHPHAHEECLQYKSPSLPRRSLLRLPQAWPPWLCISWISHGPFPIDTMSTTRASNYEPTFLGWLARPGGWMLWPGAWQQMAGLGWAGFSCGLAWLGWAGWDKDQRQHSSNSFHDIGFEFLVLQLGAPHGAQQISCCTTIHHDIYIYIYLLHW